MENNKSKPKTWIINTTQYSYSNFKLRENFEQEYYHMQF